MSSNDEQIEFWNGPRAERWVSTQELMDRQLAPFGEAAVAAAGLGPGERVVDVGCGCGGTTLLLARAVGPEGSVLGVDVSRPMLARARERVGGLARVRLEEGDASTFAFDGTASLVFSRFGVMFFADPRAAFANLRRALGPAGRLAFVSWRSLAENEWMELPLAAASTATGVAPPFVEPDAPGPYAFADPARVRAILDAAGFADVTLTPFDCVVPLGEGKGLEAATDQALTVGPASRMMSEATPDQAARARRAVREALAPHLEGDQVSLRAAAWIVTARNPAS